MVKKSPFLKYLNLKEKNHHGYTEYLIHFVGTEGMQQGLEFYNMR